MLLSLLGDLGVQGVAGFRDKGLGFRASGLRIRLQDFRVLGA